MQSKTITPDEAAGRLADAIGQLDDLRLEGLVTANQLLQAKDALQQTEIKRLTTKYGRNSIPVQNALMKVAYNIKMFAAFEAHIVLTKVQQQDFDPKTWRLQGIISDTNNNPLPNCTVSLAQQKNDSNKAVCSAITNDIGFYSMTLSNDTLTVLNKASLFASVKDSKNKITQKDSSALAPTAGVIDIKNIRLSGNKTC